ncbi:bis(5'-nucleosyl)-tetraphosphatase (symmetrical) YqeK [Anaerotalea alkaliphila]|uniref:bis(5'-nucleosyl)-tetraphosphatase (symmetrical) n=1 Tax=Anaerotalea alkaliphila TaxID=2662126 RepID=A0A7X5KMK3_9FIRM|nr:bis(5'-nucleosyl)-tetraphosphatase (symmetrical) YqeK [Anaerotalea alkaliphila]NDL67924.1 HD domain-containing protein [Anaerotalea alkaliphila]
MTKFLEHPLEVKQRLSMRKTLKRELEERRYEHTLRVEETAVQLAMAHNVDPSHSATAALLHDCAKNYKQEKMARLCERYHIELSMDELLNNDLVHAKVGAVVAREKYLVSHPDVLNAIRYHTTGRPHMTPLDKVIFVADYIEPGRKPHGRMEEIRKLAFHDLNTSLLMILEDKIGYLLTKEKQIDQITIETYKHLSGKEIHNESEFEHLREA